MAGDDFIEQSERAAREEEYHSISGNLCCCEYIDKDNQRYHVLACCCNCNDFDLAFTRFFCCQSTESLILKDMLLTFQDRLRIPWRGGAKKVAMDVWFSAFMVAFVLGIAAINVYTAIITIVASIVFMSYAYYYVKRSLIKTRIFASWLMWSVVYMSVLMEFAVPLLEFLPEEHLILIILACTSVYCFWTTYRRSQLNHVLQSAVNEDDLPDITEVTTAEEEAAELAAHTALLMDSLDTSDTDTNICNICHKYVPTHTIHCQLCNACILQRDHHSYWLNCCIGKSNYSYYLSGIAFGVMGLLLCANLTITAVCHPFLVFRLFGIAVMLPDDCSEVFDEYALGLSFIVAIYALIMACYMFVILVQQIYYKLRSPSRQGTERRSCDFLKRWKALLF